MFSFPKPLNYIELNLEDTQSLMFFDLECTQDDGER
jgi:hypothetical protein